jgi:hypothetical protein
LKSRAASVIAGCGPDAQPSSNDAAISLRMVADARMALLARQRPPTRQFQLLHWVDGAKEVEHERVATNRAGVDPHDRPRRQRGMCVGQ